jgi:uncharacterized protein YndB with AHSA1/START domain
MQYAITLDAFYPYPPECVWHALTDRWAIATWLMDNTFEPKLGHRFQFRYRGIPDVVILIDCKVIAIQEPTRLAYTWKEFWMDQPSIVTWVLEPVTEGTKLYISHCYNFNELAAPRTKPLISPAQFWQTQVSSYLEAVMPSYSLSTPQANLLGSTTHGPKPQTSSINTITPPTDWPDSIWTERVSQRLLSYLSSLAETPG